MSFMEEYQRKLVTPEEAVKIVKPGDWVEYGSFSGSVVVLTGLWPPVKMSFGM